MKPLFNIKNKIDRKKLYDFECEFCGKVFSIAGTWIALSLTNKKHNSFTFCSRKCRDASKIIKIKKQCAQCSKDINVLPRDIKKSKSGNVFCSRSCATTYNNTHKTYGTRRSKLEHWIEENLTNLYPTLEILYNNVSTINAELDIYIPSLQLAFELNGIFHYEPIFGADKLASIKNNEERKFQACLSQNIELVIIDTSALKKFKSHRAMQYLEIIKKIINYKLVPRGGFEPTL